MTKIDREIQEGLYDPKKKKSKAKSVKGKLTITGKKPVLKKLKKHLEKEHPSTKGKMKVNDPEKPDIYAPRGQSQSISSEGQRRAMFANIDKLAAKAKWVRKMRKGTARGLRFNDPNPKPFLGVMPESEHGSFIVEDFFNDTNTMKSSHLLEKLANMARQQKKTNKTYRQGRQLLTELADRAQKGTLRLNDPNKKPSQWFDAMVAGIERSSDVKNPRAIVNQIWQGLSPEKKNEILKRSASGEIFRYDLPLPDDRATKGIGTLRMVKPFNLAEAQVNVSAKDMQAIKKSGIFRPMKREDGTVCQVARCKSRTPVNIFVDELK